MSTAISTPESLIQTRIGSPIAQANYWRTSILQTPSRFVEAITNALDTRPAVPNIAKELLCNTAYWCDQWTDGLKKDVSRRTAGFVVDYEPSNAQQYEESYAFMRLSVLDHLVWLVMPEAFPLSSNAISQVDTLATSRKQVEGWEEAIKGVIMNILKPPQESATIETADPVTPFDQRANILFDQYSKLVGFASTSRAQANLISLAMGFLMYAVRIIHLYSAHVVY
jgi:hypothetical protein